MNNNYTRTPHNTSLKIDGENNKISIISKDSERFLSADEVIDGLNLEIKGNNNFIKPDRICGIRNVYEPLSQAIKTLL